MSKAYRLIPLTQGQWAIVDASDYAYLNQWRWCAWRPSPKYESFYARRRSIDADGKVKAIAMHVLILGEKEGMVVDHWNGCSLDNRRKNLRHVTRSINKLNTGESHLRKGCPKVLKINHPTDIDRPLSVRNTSGFENIFSMKERWGARIVIRGKTYYLGIYDTREEANEAYLAAKSKVATNPRYRPARKPSSRNKSGAIGVSWHKASNKWRVAKTTRDESGAKRHIHIGTFSNKQDALTAWRKYQKEAA